MHHIRMKTLAASALAAVTALTLAACSSGSVSGNTGSDSGGRTTITVWHQVTGDATKTLNTLVSKYNSSQSKYTVKTQFAATSDQFPAKLLNSLKNGTAPNMVLSDSLPQSISQYVQTGKIVALDDKLSSGDITKSSFTDGMLATGTVDGKVYSLPTDGGDYGLVYNKQMFKDAGISSAPTTWAEVEADAKKLTKNGRYGIYLPIGTGEWPVFTWESMLWGAGGELLNSDNTKVAFNSAEGVTALSTWTNLVKNKLAYPSSLATASDGQGISSLSAKKVAMVITGAYNLNTLDGVLGKDNVGTAKLPTLSTPAMNTGTDNSYIIKGSSAQEAGSWDFLKYWLSPTAQSTWDIATGYLPTNKATISSTAYTEYLASNPRLQPFVDELAYAKARPSILAYDGVSAALSTQIEKAMLQQISPSAALAAAETDAQKALDSNN